jgi:hypothetical protein
LFELIGSSRPLGFRRERVSGEQRGVAGDRTTQRLHVHDAIGDVDDERNGPSPARACNDVRARHDTVRVRGLIEERPRQPSLIHRVEIDDHIDRIRRPTDPSGPTREPPPKRHCLSACGARLKVIAADDEHRIVGYRRATEPRFLLRHLHIVAHYRSGCGVSPARHGRHGRATRPAPVGQTGVMVEPRWVMSEGLKRRTAHQ